MVWHPPCIPSWQRRSSAGVKPSNSSLCCAICAAGRGVYLPGISAKANERKDSPIYATETCSGGPPPFRRRRYSTPCAGSISKFPLLPVLVSCRMATSAECAAAAYDSNGESACDVAADDYHAQPDWPDHHLFSRRRGHHGEPVILPVSGIQRAHLLQLPSAAKQLVDYADDAAYYGRYPWERIRFSHPLTVRIARLQAPRRTTSGSNSYRRACSSLPRATSGFSSPRPPTLSGLPSRSLATRQVVN